MSRPGAAVTLTGAAAQRSASAAWLRALAYRIVPLLLIAGVTLAALAAGGVVLAHKLFLAPTGIDKCLIMNDPRTGPRGLPGSYCRGNAAETRPVDYRFNECGFRTPHSCRPAAPGIFRIVMIGSSFNFGLYVQQSESFAVLLESMLSIRLQRPVDVVNESIFKAFDGAWAQRSELIMQPRPQMILWPLTPHDMVPCDGPPPPAGEPKMPAAELNFGSPTALWATVINKLSKSTEGVMLQHYLFRSESQYLDHALMEHSEVEYLRVPASAFERACIAQFAADFHQVAANARAAKVPLVVTLLPAHEQAIMLANDSWGQGYDPNQLGRQVRRIVEAEGVRYVDIMPELRSVPNAGAGYLPVDGHPNREGNRMFAELVGTALMRTGTVPAMKGS